MVLGEVSLEGVDEPEDGAFGTNRAQEDAVRVQTVPKEKSSSTL